MEIIHARAHTGHTNIVYQDLTDTYIDIDQVDDLSYLADGKSFMMSSEKSGYKHLYHYHIDGTQIGQVTRGDWSVTQFHGINEAKKTVYFTSTKVSPLQRHLYQVDLKGKNMKQISEAPGTHAINFSRDFKFYVDTYSSLIAPPTTILYNAAGKELKVMAENSRYLALFHEYGMVKTTLFSIPVAGDSLNGYLMKPSDFDINKKYPLLMYVYGGPGSQKVIDQWNGNLWHQYLVQQGYMVACIDNRGTGGRGRDFQHVTYQQLGKYEVADQIAAAKFMGDWAFIDAKRIGIWGWSYGGYMSSLAILLGNDVFKTAIAVAPVTNWRFYDSIYTERYLKKPGDNPSGYDDFSPINHAEKLKGDYLLVHGTGDDNVHFQNAIELQNALIKANKQFDSFSIQTETMV
ncbi:MAG: S9 family peptidase [Cyclobacteriaceae bacterium]|nr:S9 family peptidase [Cyclobacteriaceae bacterium]